MTQTEATRNSADQEVADAKTPRRALRVNGAAKFQAPLEGSLVINHQEAFALICAAEETYSQHTGVVKEELQAIVSHWLQSPKDSPILLDESFRDRWLDLLHSQCLLRGVRHKLLIFNHANHVLESSNRKRWPGILTLWVWRVCRSQRGQA